MGIGFLLRALGWLFLLYLMMIILLKVYRLLLYISVLYDVISSNPHRFGLYTETSALAFSSLPYDDNTSEGLLFIVLYSEFFFSLDFGFFFFLSLSYSYCFSYSYCSSLLFL